MTRVTRSESRETNVSWRKEQDGLVSIRVRNTHDNEPLASFLHVSDIHFDSPHCNRELLRHDLDFVKERGSYIISLGDLNDVMQTRNDKRRRNSEMRKEYSKDDYLGEVSRDTISFFKNDPFILAGDGNHEDSVLRSCGFDMTQAFVDGINVNRSEREKAIKIGYSGFIVYSIEYDKNTHFRYVVSHHHGFGGGGANKGVPQFNSRMLSMEADAYIMGHIHQTTHHKENISFVSRDMRRIEQKRIDMIRIAGYKPEHRDCSSYGSQKGYRPTDCGSWMLEFFRSNRTNKEEEGIHAVWTEIGEYIVRERSKAR